MIIKILNILDDVLVVCGCVALVYGVSLFGPQYAWVAGGILMIYWGVVIADYLNKLKKQGDK